MLCAHMLSWVTLCAANAAAAQLRLGVMYEHGLGVKLDYQVQTALDLHRRSTMSLTFPKTAGNTV